MKETAESILQRRLYNTPGLVRSSPSQLLDVFIHASKTLLESPDTIEDFKCVARLSLDAEINLGKMLDTLSNMTQYRVIKYEDKLKLSNILYQVVEERENPQKC